MANMNRVFAQLSFTLNSIPLELGTTSPLSLPHIRPQDAGIYTCRLQNALGSIRADFSVQVTEQFGEDGSDEDAILLHPSGNLSPGSAPPHSILPPPPPPRIEQPQAQMLKAGNTAQLQCRVEWRGEGDKAVIRVGDIGEYGTDDDVYGRRE
jgi:hypothetical protein